MIDGLIKPLPRLWRPQPIVRPPLRWPTRPRSRRPLPSLSRRLLPDTRIQSFNAATGLPMYEASSGKPMKDCCCCGCNQGCTSAPCKFLLSASSISVGDCSTTCTTTCLNKARAYNTDPNSPNPQPVINGSWTITGITESGPSCFWDVNTGQFVEWFTYGNTTCNSLGPTPKAGSVYWVLVKQTNHWFLYCAALTSLNFLTDCGYIMFYGTQAVTDPINCSQVLTFTNTVVNDCTTMYAEPLTGALMAGMGSGGTVTLTPA